MQSQDDPAQRWWRWPRTRAWDRKKGTGGAPEVGERGGAEGDTGTVFTVGFRVLGPGQGIKGYGIQVRVSRGIRDTGYGIYTGIRIRDTGILYGGYIRDTRIRDTDDES